LKELYRENPDSKGLQKLRMCLLCRECSEMIVAAVIAEARQEEKIFLRDKYKLRRSFTALSCKLHIHINGLQRWRDKFLSEVAQLMNYELPERDIWSYRKVSVLVKVVERNIEFLGTYGKGADEESLRWLHGLGDVYLHEGRAVLRAKGCFAGGDREACASGAHWLCADWDVGDCAPVGLVPGWPGRHRHAHKHCRRRCCHAGSV